MINNSACLQQRVVDPLIPTSRFSKVHFVLSAAFLKAVEECLNNRLRPKMFVTKN